MITFCLPFPLHLTYLSSFGFPNTDFPPLFLAVHSVSPLLGFCPCFLYKYRGFHRVLILAPKNASLSLDNLIHPHRFNYYLLSDKYAGSTLSPGLSLQHQTHTSNYLQAASTWRSQLLTEWQSGGWKSDLSHAKALSILLHSNLSIKTYHTAL